MPIAHERGGVAQVRGPHPSTERDRQPLAPRRRGRERDPVVLGDAHDDHVAARPDQADGRVERGVRPRALEDDIHGVDVGVARCRRRRARRRRPGGASGLDAMGEPVGRQDRGRAAGMTGPDDEQADRSGAHDRDARGRPDPPRSTARSATPSASSWQASAGSRAAGTGTSSRRGQVIHSRRPPSVSPNPANRADRAEVLQAARTRRARPARLRRVDDDGHGHAVLDDRPGDLMTEDEAAVEPGLADPGRLPPVGIRAAQSDGRDPDQGFVRSGDRCRLIANDQLMGPSSLAASIGRAQRGSRRYATSFQRSRSARASNSVVSSIRTYSTPHIDARSAMCCRSSA